MVNWWTEPHGDWLATVTVMVFCGMAGLLTMAVIKLSERTERRELEEEKRRATAAPESH
ncbi:MAG: hypothetical protein JWO97_1676 [Acidobacteria bacterium]|jgi:hypothetical protein|nr:hypothetical protein [Acidobacteriota bacterium]